MARRTLVVLLAALVALSAPLATAQDQAATGEPDCTQRSIPNGTLAPCLVFPDGPPTDGLYPGTVRLEYTFDDAGPWNVTVRFGSWFASDTFTTGATDAASGVLTADFNVPENATTPQVLDYAVTVHRLFTPPSPTAPPERPPAGNGTSGNATDGNQTSDGNQTADGNQTVDDGSEPPSTFGAGARWELFAETRFQHTIQVPGQAPPTGVPIAWFVGAGVLAFLLVAGTVVLVQRQRKPEHTIRSRTLQELEQERRGGGPPPPSQRAESTTAEPEAAPRPKRTSGQRAILEARLADVQRILDLADQRRDQGEITDHQYNLIKERKQKELAEVEQELRDLED